jgi:hemerythrin-like metal-binding protein
MRRPTWIVTWNAEMSVGIPDLDNDHKHLFFLLNGLNRSITEGKSPIEIKKWVQVIIDDAALHFAHEEKILIERRYPSIDVHARIQSKILHSLQYIKKLYSL